MIQAISASSTCFAKLGLTHRFLQLTVNKEYSALTTLPSGLCRYLRAPMGLSSSSDKWFLHSDRVVKGLPWTKKIVDDILIWAPDMDSLESRLATVLDRCAKAKSDKSQNLKLVTNYLLLALLLPAMPVNAEKLYQASLFRLLYLMSNPF